MASIDTEAIWAALTDRLKENASGFNRVSRRRRDWSIEECPVLMVLDDSGDEDPVSDPSAPAPVWRLGGELIILARTQDTDEQPTAKLNDLVKNVREALERKPTDPIGSGAFYGNGHVQHYTNLGGLIREFSISKVEKGSGEATGKAVAKITIQMETVAL